MSTALLPLISPVVPDSKQAVLDRILTKNIESLIAAELYDAASTLISTSLIFDPGRTDLLHTFGKVMQLCGQTEDAELLFRGVVPDVVNEKYFGSASISKKLLSASKCVDTSVDRAFAEESIGLSEPYRNPSDRTYGQFNHKTTKARASFCSNSRNGSFWFDGFNTIVLDGDGNILREHVKGNEFVSYNCCMVKKPEILKGTVCFLGSRSEGIYYHWMLDVIPKLGVVENSGTSLSDIDYFVIGCNSKYQKETLLSCGVSSSKIISPQGHQYYQAEQLLVPYLRNDLGDKIYRGLGVGLASWIPRYLKSKFIDRINEIQDHPKKIYISRSAAGSRNIVNEPKLIELLKERDFVVVEFERMSVHEQAALMSNVEVVVGVHGAGLTNLCFCSAGVRVIEIFGDYIVPCYWALSGVTDLEYRQYMARSKGDIDTANPGKVVQHMRSLEIDIDSDHFIKYLDEQINTCSVDS